MTATLCAALAATFVVTSAQDPLTFGPFVTSPAASLTPASALAPMPAMATGAPGGGLAGTAMAAQGGAGVTAIYSNVAGSSSALVPGTSSTRFEPGTSTNHFDRIYGHPSGHWILTCNADLPASENECLIVDGQLAMKEGEPAPWTAGENCGTIDQRCAINVRGDFVFATNTSGSVNDDYIAGFVAGNWVTLAREGEAVPGLPGATLDDAIDSPLVLDDGRVGYAADGIDGVGSTAEDDILILAGSVLAQEGVTMPAGQASATLRAIENFDLGDFFASGDGAHWIAQGDLFGSAGTDDVVLVDGDVVLQEGAVVPGSGFAEPIDSLGIFAVSMDVGGAWYARGDNDGTNDDWVVRNGVVIATTGQPLVAGAAEAWDDTGFANGFFAHAGNSLGNYVIGGTTDHPDAALDAAIVLDGTRVMARESDPVDLDGNGVLDDGVFIDTFGDDDVILSDTLELIFVATLKDAGGQRIGQGVLRIAGGPSIGVAHCDSVPNSTGAVGDLRAIGSPSLAVNSLQLVADDLPAGAFGIMLVGTERGDSPLFGGGVGTLCVAGRFGAYRRPGEILFIDQGGSVTFDVDLNLIRGQGADVPAVVGEALSFQLYHRDLLMNGASTSNATRAIEITIE